MIAVSPNLIIILLGIFHVFLYLIICFRKNKQVYLFNILMHFLNGFVPYGAYESFYGGLTLEKIPSDHYQIILVMAGISLAWLYYHLLSKLMEGSA